MRERRCKHCREVVRLFNFALGPQWLHVQPDASFPTERKGTAWRHCRGRVAEPEEVASDE